VTGVVDRGAALLPGLALAAALALVATGIGAVLPVLGAPVAAIVLGVLVGLVRRPGATLQPGVKVAGRFVLQLAVVLLGTQLSLARIAEVGLSSLPVLVGTLAVCFVAAWLVGRGLGVVGDLRTLIGVGTGVCGASAIAAVTPVIGAASGTVAYAVSTIFLFNAAAVLVFPALGHLIGLDQQAFGLFAGTAINDTSSVVAAAAAYGDLARDEAVVVKLVRTLAIIPIVLALAAWVARRDRRDGDALGSRASRVARLVPWFLVGFLVAAAVNSTGLLPDALRAGASTASVFLITTAMAAIGLSTDVAGFRRAGWRPLALGGLLWLAVSASSLGLQAATGGLG
jgi:uncharacterized integral membrane protein (TIGR00698 family)